MKMPSSQSESKTLLKVFKFIDVDNNGVLTPQEFKEAMTRFGLYLSDGEIEAFFGKYDADRSGTLDYFEFSGAIERIRSHVHSTSMAHSFYSK